MLIYSSVISADENFTNFYPRNEGFEIVNGPSDKIILRAKNCQGLTKIKNDLNTWRSKVELLSRDVNESCGCQDDIKPEIYDYLYQEAERKQGLKNFQFFKKNKLKNSIKTFCYLDITELLPTRAKELTLRQIALDSNPYKKICDFYGRGKLL